MPRPHRTPLIAALFALSLAACEQDPIPPPASTEPEPLPVATNTPIEAPSTSAAADAGTDAGASIDSLVGSWEGAYEAKKGRVGIPTGVKDDRATDDGKAASGPGTVKLTVLPGGDVTGKSEGALGKASVRGKLDGKTLRASFVPDDPLPKSSMTGVLVGLVKGDVIQAELRVAGPDALVVRQANFDLKKK
jgi:hypothetical protein